MPASRAPASFAVVELFTSEGCSSCPPADKLLSELAAESERDGKSVFTLSFHVDYWNYLGWADPFSRTEFSERQERYARALGGRVYTPQMIVNGKEEFVGSQGGTARKTIGSALGQSASAAIALESERGDGKALEIRYRVTGHREGDLLNIALVEKGLSVPVKRGENGGRTLKHENVVRDFRTVRLDAQGSGTVKLEMKEGLRRENASLIAYAQQAESLHMLGAARAPLPPAQ
ncbi:MAG: hypothetical protein JWO30_3426 [Fibrobacteres bacterium]|nr:hypothetical protein [Fibrobacterota bacterium]